MNQIIGNILRDSMKQKIIVFVDMDGVVAEFKFSSNEERNLSEGYYLKSRPIKSTIKILKNISKIANVEVHILSQCNKEFQKKEKIKWLKNNMNFIDVGNIYIIVKESIKYSDKNLLKANYIKKIIDPKNKYYLIDDNHNILLLTKETIPTINIYHVSSLLD